MGPAVPSGPGDRAPEAVTPVGSLVLGDLDEVATGIARRLDAFWSGGGLNGNPVDIWKETGGPLQHWTLQPH